MLHLSAHALVDDDRPERSAVVLSPGASDEDGLLQPAEAEALDLEGPAVVLAACRSSSGAVLAGEGTLSLARSFFQAGAHAVVGTLLEVRDDEAGELLTAFYRRLAEGRGVAESMQLARISLAREGAPAAAWAGFVVLGDGDLVPIRASPDLTAPWGRRAAVAATLVLTAGIALLFLRRRAPSILW